MSSHSPTATMTVIATTTPCGSELRANSGSNVSINRATVRATRNPPYIASPPNAGIGLVWTVRSLGSYSQPRQRARRPTTGGRRNVVTPATRPMMRYEPVAGTIDQPRSATATVRSTLVGDGPPPVTARSGPGAYTPFG